MQFMTPKDKPATERDIALDLGARDASWGEAMAANAANAWDWTIPGRAQDALQETHAQVKRYGGGNWLENAMAAEKESIPQEEWPKSEFYREGIEWDERMNPARAQVLAGDYDERRTREAILSRQTTAQKVAGFGVQLGVGLTDPVNYLPFVSQVRTAKMVGRMGSVFGRMAASGIDAGVGNLLLNPVVGADLERRGETITLDDYVFDMMVGAGVGMLFGGVRGAWMKHFRGEKKSDLLRAYQAATLSVEQGRAADVAPVIKEMVEANQFSRETALQRLTDGGVDAGQADVFLTHLDGVAAASGTDVPTWYRRHIAEVSVGGDVSGEGIRFHAAMYRSPAASLGQFVENVRNNPSGKTSYFQIGDMPDELGAGQLLINSDVVNHIFKGHPEQAAQSISTIMDVIMGHDRMFAGDPKKNTFGGDSQVFIKYNGDEAHIVVVETVDGKKGKRSFVKTSFTDNKKSVDGWAKEKEARLVPSDSLGNIQASQREGVSQINASSNTNIKRNAARGKQIRATIEEMQARAKNRLPLLVVDAFDDLPEHLREHATSRGIDGVHAVNDGDTVYIVADAIESVDQAVGIWLHEQGLHYGLRGLVGDDAKFNALMDGVFDHFGADALDDIRHAYGLDFSNAAHRREAAEEMLAHIAEKITNGRDLSDLEIGAWDSIKAWLRDWLRSHGFDVEMTDEEIAGIVKDAVRWTMDGKASVSRQGPQRFAVDGKRHGSIEFTADGRAHIRIAEGADLHRAGEAVSRILAERFNDFPPRERLDWRAEGAERDVPDTLDGVEPDVVADELLARDMGEVQMMADAGRLTEAELMEVKSAERGVEQAGRYAEAFKAAAACITRGGI
ncbi:hypothetical protein [Pseudodesulfovibrio pelocollis]|uniref:PBECR3 domain-containing polyvalent protein n=1 Tax=Pseudodesulfovibrio pelocollis TaxID=3051432 RepID=UPI00255AB82C|nr:hypothetical protein [Pseudodesulfovibrio sp. SB368]